jgi:hypothetical protein
MFSSRVLTGLLLLVASVVSKAEDCDQVLLARTAGILQSDTRYSYHWLNAATEETFNAAKLDAGASIAWFSGTWSQAQEERRRTSTYSQLNYSQQESRAILLTFLPAEGFDAWTKCKQSDPLHKPTFVARITGEPDGLQFIVTLRWIAPSKREQADAPLQNVTSTSSDVDLTSLPKDSKKRYYLPEGSTTIRVSRASNSSPVNAAVNGLFAKEGLSVDILIPAYKPITLPAYPMLVTTALLRDGECSTRLGATCFQFGNVYTAPPNDGDGVAKFNIPVGARYFLSTLTEFSGQSCNGGGATSYAAIDGVRVFAHFQSVTENKNVVVPIPMGAKVLTLGTSADGDKWCDDPLWVTPRFDLKAQ